MISAIEYTDYQTSVDVPVFVLDISANVGPQGPSGVPGALPQLSDVSDSTVFSTAGHVLRTNGSAWINSAIQAGDLPSEIDAVKIANGSVDNAEFQALNGVTSGIQSQLNGKAAVSHTHDASAIETGQLHPLRLPHGTPRYLGETSWGTTPGVDYILPTAEFTQNDVGEMISCLIHAPNDANPTLTIGDFGPYPIVKQTPSGWIGLEAADYPEFVGADTSKVPALLCWHKDQGGAWYLMSTFALHAADMGVGTANDSKFLRGDRQWSNQLTGPLQVVDGVSGTGNHTFHPNTSVGSDDGRAVLFGGGTPVFTASRGGFVIAHGINHATESCNVLIRPGSGGVTKINQPNSSAIAVQIDATGITLPNSPFIQGNSTNNIVVCPGTASGTDDKIAYLFGGGTTTPTGARGAYVAAHGANHATRANIAFVSSGTNGKVQLALDNSVRFTLDSVTSQIQISNFPLVLGSGAAIVAASNSIAGTASGVQINAPTASAILLQTNGTTRATCGVNGMVFSSNATAVLSTNISVGSGAANTLSLNAPTGGSVNTLVAGTSRLNVSATAATLTVPLVTPTATPANSSAPGTAGQWAWDSGFLYICTATNTWRRVAHATW